MAVSEHTFKLIIDGDAGIQEARRFRQTWDQEMGALGRPGGAGMTPEARLNAIKGGLDTASNALLVFGGAGIAAAGMAAKAAMDWESAWTGVIKTVADATDAEGQLTTAGAELQAQLREMARDTIPIENAHERLARLASIAGQLGIETPNIAEFTEVMAKLGESTEDLPSEEAAVALAQFANITAMSQGDFDRLGATIVHLGNNLATTEGRIVEFGQRIAGAGEIAGLSEADILAIGAAMSSMGIEAEAGGTAVQKVLISMTQAMAEGSTGMEEQSEKAAELQAKIAKLQRALEVAMQKDIELSHKEGVAQSAIMAAEANVQNLQDQIRLTEHELATLSEEGGGKLEIFAQTAGVTADEFQRLWKEDAAEAFRLFVVGLGQQGDQAFSTLETLELADQRLIRAFISLSGNSDILTQSLGLANTAWEENTALNEEAARRFATTANQWERTKNIATDMLITLGGVLLPRVNTALQTASDLLSKFLGYFQSLPEATQQKWVNLGLGIAGAALALGTITKIASTAIGTYMSLAKAIQAVTMAQTAQGTAGGGMGGVGRLAMGVGGGLIAGNVLTEATTGQNLAQFWSTADEAARGALETQQAYAQATREELVAAMAEAEAELTRLQGITTGQLWNPLQWAQLPEEIKAKGVPSARLLDSAIAETQARLDVLRETMANLEITALPTPAEVENIQQQITPEFDYSQISPIEEAQMRAAEQGIAPEIAGMLGDPSQLAPAIQDSLGQALAMTSFSSEAMRPVGMQFTEVFTGTLVDSLLTVPWSEHIGTAIATDFGANLEGTLRPIVQPVGRQIGEWLAEGAAESSFSQAIIATVMEQLAEAVAQ